MVAVVGMTVFLCLAIVKGLALCKRGTRLAMCQIARVAWHKKKPASSGIDIAVKHWQQHNMQ
jgi:hypothetical protein